VARGRKFVILDACRNNPFLDKMRRVGSLTRGASTRGLIAVPTAPRMIVAFAAQEGMTASDGAGEHSPYTTALLHNIPIPGLAVHQMFEKVTEDVLAATNSEQRPNYLPDTFGWTPFYFVAPEPGQVTAQTTVPVLSPSGEATTPEILVAAARAKARSAQSKAFVARAKAVAAQEPAREAANRARRGMLVTKDHGRLSSQSFSRSIPTKGSGEMTPETDMA